MPAAAERAIELDESEGFALLRTHQVQLGSVQIRIGGQHFKVSRRPALVPDTSQTRRILCGFNQLLLLLAISSLLVQSNQRIGDIAECAGDCSFDN